MKISELKKLDDAALAGHQAQYNPQSRPWKVCELEFKRRERKQNLKSSILLILVGFLLGLIPWILDKWTDCSDQKIEIINPENK